MFKTIKNALKTPDVRKRILYTLLLLVIFRLGCYITVPGVDAVALQNATLSTGIGAYINLISGGAFSRLSLFAISISPYITASIVVQLLAMIIPSLERLTKEGGEQGRKVINRYTKIITIILSLVQSVALYFTYNPYGLFVDSGFLTASIVTVSLMAGTSLLIWIAEQIDSRGIGNGISLLIFAGIISGLPSSVVTIGRLILTDAGLSTTGIITTIGIIAGALVLIAGVVFVQEAERRVPVQYSKKVVGRKMIGGQNTHIPLKLVMAGVMPVIFASTFMTFPAMLIQTFNQAATTPDATGFWAVVFKFSSATMSSSAGIGYSIANAIVYLLLILGFTFFYTYATYNPAEMSNNIKKNGGFVPGIRAGKPTTDYLSSIMTKLTLFGGMFLALIAILPMLLTFTGLNISFGGTSILIVVGVALETVRQLESQLMMRHYKGFLE